MPFFEVKVTSPRKVNDAINPYTVYKVITKTNSTAFREREFSVSRRFRDFYWLHEQLSNGNPGVIVPPPPEKHVLGRFQEDFVESRRLGLERMIQKIMTHPHLYGDPDVKIFLESEKFNEHVTSRRKNSSKGLFQILGNVMSGATATFIKHAEPDEWFEARRNQLDQLETQIKGLHKAIESVSKQRKELATNYQRFGDGLMSVASFELKPEVAVLLEDYAQLQKNLKEVYDAQSQTNMGTLGAMTDEYLRMIGAVRAALNSRTKIYSTWQSLYNDLDRRRLALPKAEKSYNFMRYSELKEEMNQLERRVMDTKHEFEDITKLVRSELDRFDREKVEDYQKCLEFYLSSMISSQEQIIKLWEDFVAHVESGDSEAVEIVNKEYTMDPDRKDPEPYSVISSSPKRASLEDSHLEHDVEINVDVDAKERQPTNWSLPSTPVPMSPPTTSADKVTAPIPDDTTTSVWN
ncbi:Vacuolar protein sorting-associated protein vps5 [Entomophthora muscae]|uniref:Vacuolar protein sorting-associated protein vps5 n=1 Tax=Entomophthora muscae TaxID=34485 RepID=A0ACC2SPY6_9FUNG|nr:Vacuolar protein sorting-associated protein vps5 [Entomophthora muscae]